MARLTTRTSARQNRKTVDKDQGGVEVASDEEKEESEEESSEEDEETRADVLGAHLDYCASKYLVSIPSAQSRPTLLMFCLDRMLQTLCL